MIALQKIQIKMWFAQILWVSLLVHLHLADFPHNFSLLDLLCRLPFLFWSPMEKPFSEALSSAFGSSLVVSCHVMSCHVIFISLYISMAVTTTVVCLLMAPHFMLLTHVSPEVWPTRVSNEWIGWFYSAMFQSSQICLISNLLSSQLLHFYSAVPS